MEPFIFRVRDCYYIRASYPSPAEHRHFAAHLVFAMERPFTALVDGKSVETVGIAIGSDVPHTILSVDPALVVFIDELTPMSRCVKHTVAGCSLAGAGCVCFFQGGEAVGRGTHGDRCGHRRC